MMSVLLEPFTYGYMTNAMWVSALVGAVCAFLSAYLMLKGWSLIGDALSHSIVPGVAGAYMLGLPFSLGQALQRSAALRQRLIRRVEDLVPRVGNATNVGPYRCLAMKLHDLLNFCSEVIWLPANGAQNIEGVHQFDVRPCQALREVLDIICELQRDTDFWRLRGYLKFDVSEALTNGHAGSIEHGP